MSDRRPSGSHPAGWEWDRQTGKGGSREHRRPPATRESTGSHVARDKGLHRAADPRPLGGVGESARPGREAIVGAPSSALEHAIVAFVESASTGDYMRADRWLCAAFTLADLSA